MCSFFCCCLSTFCFFWANGRRGLNLIHSVLRQFLLSGVAAPFLFSRYTRDFNKLTFNRHNNKKNRNTIGTHSHTLGRKQFKLFSCGDPCTVVGAGLLQERAHFANITIVTANSGAHFLHLRACVYNEDDLLFSVLKRARNKKATFVTQFFNKLNMYVHFYILH